MVVLECFNMDHRFREDENELPYLVVSKRDNIKGSSIDTRSNEEKLDDIIDKLYVSDLEKLLIKSALLKFLSSKDCTGLVAEDDFTSASFTIIRENDYIQTRSEFLFSQDLFRVKRVFWDCYTSHNHDGLLSNPRFRQLVNDTPYEFEDVVGGYESRYNGADDVFELLDEINVRVAFKVDSRTKRSYKLDLDTMKLSDDYFEYSI